VGQKEKERQEGEEGGKQGCQIIFSDYFLPK
jgi:hypothetical protein